MHKTQEVLVMLKIQKINRKYIWWMVAAGLFGIVGLLLVPVANYAIKLANRYPKLFEWILMSVWAVCVLCIKDSNMRFILLCAVVAFSSNKLSANKR